MLHLRQVRSELAARVETVHKKHKYTKHKKCLTNLFLAFHGVLKSAWARRRLLRFR